MRTRTREKFWLILGFVMASLFLSSFSVADDIESLIQSEKVVTDEWPDEGDALPPVAMVGDEAAVFLYNRFLDEADLPSLCAQVPLEELREFSSGPKDADEVVLNVKLPAVRTLLADSCLVRPGDMLMAVRRGENSKVEATKFFLKDTRDICETPSVNGLWMGVKPALPETPFAFSSDNRIKEGPNGFVEAVVVATCTFSPEEKALLSRSIKFFDDYLPVAYCVESANVQKLYDIRRRQVSNDDAGLPNQIVAVFTHGRMETLVTESVRESEPTGRLSLVGWLDYNQDGLTDVVVEGQRGRCQYRIVFEGIADGLEKLALPPNACGCP